MKPGAVGDMVRVGARAHVFACGGAMRLGVGLAVGVWGLVDEPRVVL